MSRALAILCTHMNNLLAIVAFAAERYDSFASRSNDTSEMPFRNASRVQKSNAGTQLSCPPLLASIICTALCPTPTYEQECKREGASVGWIYEAFTRKEDLRNSLASRHLFRFSHQYQALLVLFCCCSNERSQVEHSMST